MDKEFVKYEQALELKELGFDEPCLTCYDKLEMIASHGKNVFDYKNYNTSGYMVSRPTFSQAFRWFRDKYSIHAEITWDPSYEYDPGEWSDAIYEITFVDVSYTKEWKAESPDMQRNEGNQLTYEEAESACLDKLIELIKDGTRN
jgi:hypothetical protein